MHFSTLPRDYLGIPQQKHHMLPLSYSSPLLSNNYSGGTAIISSLSQVHSHEAIQWLRANQSRGGNQVSFCKSEFSYSHSNSALQ